MRGLSWSFLGSLVAIGLAWRLVIVGFTPMPREDGVNYLWMAERFAAGDVAAALSDVFSPLLAMVIAIPVACGIEPFLAGQLALAVVGAFVVVPVARISEELRPGTGWLAGLLVFVAFRPVLLGAWIYTEPLFLLVAGYAFLFGLRKRYALCGCLAGLAFWIRPEAAVIPVAFFLGNRRAWKAFVPLGLLILALASWRAVCGHGFDPVPKLKFIMDHNVAEHIGGFERLVEVPARILEAFGPMSLLAVVGAWRRRPAPVMWLLLFATVIIWAYVPRWRFFVNWMFVVAPLAAFAVERLRGRKWWLAAVIVIDLGLAANGGSDANRVVERQVGEYLGELLRPGETVTGDMTRVLYFAGVRPLPPRHFTVDELVTLGRDARFVVLRSRRRVAPNSDRLVADAVEARLTRHAEVPLPAEFAERAKQRGLRVLGRR
jgi:hypothetical protein